MIESGVTTSYISYGPRIDGTETSLDAIKSNAEVVEGPWFSRQEGLGKRGTLQL